MVVTDRFHCKQWDHLNNSLPESKSFHSRPSCWEIKIVVHFSFHHSLFLSDTNYVTYHHQSLPTASIYGFSIGVVCKFKCSANLDIGLPSVGHPNISFLDKNFLTLSFGEQWGIRIDWCHYNDAIMGAMASHITSLTSVYPTAYSGADQRQYQSSSSLAFVGEFTGERWIPRTNGL